MKPKNLCVYTLSMLFAGFSFLHAADEIKWNGTSGKWSDGSIWEGGNPPSKDQTAGFSNGRKGTIEIDGDFQVHTVLVKQNGSNDNEYPVTFTGSGSLVATNATFIVNTKRRLVLDGPTLICNDIKIAKVLEIKNGTLFSKKLRPWDVATVVSVTNGRIVADELSANYDGSLLAATNSVLMFGSVTKTHNYELSGGSFAVTNGGLKIASGVTEAHFDVDEFALAGNLDATEADVKVVFDRGVNIGAYADWSTGGNIAEMCFAKSPVFNTTDAADNETNRIVTIKNFRLQSQYDSIAVSGRGTLVISPMDNPFRFETLLLNDGADLSINNNMYGLIRLSNLEMKPDSSISLAAGKASFEIDSTKIAPTASVEVREPSETNLRSLLWTDFSNGAKPTFICKENGAYSVRTAGPFAFAVGKDAASATKDKDTEWTGLGVDPNWTTVGNWMKSVPEGVGTEGIAYFSGDTNTEITNDSARTIARMHISVNGAFAFFGESIGLNSPTINGNNSPIYNSGNLPVAVYNTLSKTSNKATGLSFVTYGDTFIALMGEVALTNHIFRFSGGMRVGGNVNCANVIFDPKFGLKHASCTILPGAELVATDQQEIQSEGVGYEVRDGGILDVRGGVWDWSIPVTNRIEGTLKLGAVLGSSSRLYFSGRGDIELSGDALEGTGSDVVVLGSNTVKIASDATFGKWTVDNGATLTFDSSNNTLTFTETIEGDGRLVFTPGTKAALGGDLRAAALESEGVVISSAAETVGSLIWPDNYYVYLDDGVYRVKRRPGFSLSVR